MVRHLRAFAGAVSLFSMGIGVSALWGWWFHLEVLKSWLPGQPSVRFNAAVCFVLLGVALWLLRKKEEGDRRKRVVGRSAAAIVAVVGLITLTENLAGLNLGIDEVLHSVHTGEELGSVRPGLIPPLGALNLLLLGCGLLILDRKTRRGHWLAQWLAIAAAISSAVGILDFALGRPIAHTHIAFPGTINFAVVSLGLICVRAEWALGGVLASTSAGAKLLRKVVPAALGVLILMGWLLSKPLLTEAHFNWFQVSILALISSFLLVMLVAWNARILDRVEREQRKAEEALHVSKEMLDGLLGRFEDSPVEVTLRRWATGGIALAIVLTSFMGFLSWRGTRMAEEDADWVAHTQAVKVTLAAAFGHEIDIETGARGFEATGQDSFLEPYSEGQRALAQDLETLRRQTADNPTQQKRLDLLASEIDARVKHASETVEQRRRTGKAPTPAVFLEGRRRMDAVRATIAEMQNEETRLLDLRVEKTREARRRTGILAVGGTLVGVVFLMLAGFSIRRELDRSGSLRGQLKALNASLEQRVEQRTAALRESEKNYRTLFESMDEGFCTIEVLFDENLKPVDYRFLEVNPVFEKQTGIANASGRRMREIAPQHEEHWFQLYGKVALTGEPVSFEHEAAQLHRWYEVHAFRVAEPHEKKVGIVFNDITERRLREGELRESEERFRLFIEHAPAALAMFDREMRYLHMSRRWRADYGLGERDLRGVSHYDIFPDIPERRKKIHRRGLAGEVLRAEADAFVRADGISQWIWWEVRPWHDRTGAIAGIVIFAEDITERKNAEEALRLSEERMRALVNASSNAMYRMSGDWSEMHQLDGRGFIADTEAPSKDWLQTYIHPDDQALVTQTIEHAIRNKSIFELEHRVRRADGSVGWTFSRAVPRLDAGGEILDWIGMASDVTRRKCAEEELRENHARLKKVLEVETVGVMFWDLTTGALKDANSTFLNLMGYSRRDVEAGELTWQKLTPPEFQEVSRAELRKFAATGRVGPYEKEYLHKDGTRQWFVFAGSSLGGDSCVEFCVDISDRKKAEAALRESEERFQAMVNGIPQLAWMAEPDGHIFWYNQRWYEYTGTTFEQMEGWAWQSVHDPDMLPRVLEQWKGAIAAGQPFDMEFPLRGVDGVFRAFLTRVMPLKDGEGRVTRWFGTNTDISERKQAEREIRRLNDELEQRVLLRTAELQAANQEMEAFTYSVSHDLRAPLRHISGFSKILSEEYGPSLAPDAQRHLQRIQQGTLRMGQLVDDLLNLARVGRRELSLQTSGLRPIVDDLITELAPECAGRQIEWKIGNLPLVECDPGLIKQVLQNLLTNALKFTRLRPHAVIEVGQKDEPEGPVLFVRDNGVGFNMKYADKLFGVFQRLHRAEDFEGTGVGLATVQRIIQKHGGRIWAEAELDQGATFYFTLGCSQKDEFKTKAAMVGGQT